MLRNLTSRQLRWAFCYKILLLCSLLNYADSARAQAYGANMSNPILVNNISSCGGTFTDYRSNGDAALGNDYGHSSNDIFYRITLYATTTITVSHCGSNFDTYLHVLNSSGGYVTSNDDNYSSPCPGTQAYLQTTLGAGTYYVVSEGYSGNTGNILTTITATSTSPPAAGANMSNAIDAGAFNSSGSFSDSRSNADPCLGNDHGQPGNDIFYRFTLANSATVKLSHCGSGFDTYLSLLNSSGSQIMSNDDNFNNSPCPGVQSYLETTLAAGTYYVVSEGYYMNSGTIATSIVVVMESSSGISASSDQNYMITYSPRRVTGFTSTQAVVSASANPNDVQTTIQYIDGLGRPLQTVQVKGAADAAKDLVQPFQYDQYGREARKYLPFASTSNNGSYKINGLTDVITYHQSAKPGMATSFTTPYSQAEFERSPLERIIEQGAPGDAWQPASSSLSGSGHTVKTEYGTNTYEDNVLSWSFSPDGSVIGIGYVYPVGVLYKTISKDENWNSGKAGTTNEFKDRQGRLVLKRVWEDETRKLDTYYGYDDLGNLRYILPPAVNEAGSHFKPYFYFVDTEPNYHFVYTYKYDHRNRMVEKKIPGKGWEYIVYNKLNQVVATQDAEQRKSNQWLITKYDGLGRVVMTGLTSAASRAIVESGVENQSQHWENATNIGTGYSENCWPGALSTILTVNFYDNYSFPGNSYGGPAAGQSPNVTGLATGIKVNVLGTSTMLLTVNYYDAQGKLVQSKADNYVGGTLGGSDVINNTYHPITGELKASVRQHNSSTASETVATRYEYDHMGRKKEVFENINNQGEVKLSALSYTETGQLLSKKLHNDMQSTTYTYNQRGWLKYSNSDQFTYLLRYEDAAQPNWNGNISEQSWGTYNPMGNTFSYSYDKLNRLLSGSAAGMSETLSYDEMGNIKTMSRVEGATTKYGEYSYSGNRLNQIINGALSTQTYVYDDNGNATYDGRNQKSITYNILNLPQTVSGGISYTYDATGRKLRKQSSTSTDYVGGIQYTNGVIDFIQTEEGRALNMAGTYKYEYNLKDHLGNVRYSFDIYNNSVRQLQRDDYFPFGLRSTSAQGNPDNKYLYNGKELQEELGGQYDYHARFYDPAIGRFTTLDPSADEEDQESWSPYHYVYDNPIKNIDPDGKIPILSNIVGGLVAAGVEYGSQVAANVYENGFTSKAFTDNIDGGDIAIAAGEGFLTSGGSVVKNAVLKGGIKIAAEIARNAVDVKNGKVTTNSLKSTAVNTAVGLVAGKVSDKAPGTKMKVANAPTPKEAVKAARANGPVNRSQRISIETAAKTKQTASKEINSTVNKGAGGVVVGGASEEAKRKIDKKIK